MTSSTESTVPARIVQFADVVQRAEYRAETAGLDQWMGVDIQNDAAYMEFLTAAVTDLAVIPAERESLGDSVPDLDEETTLVDALQRIISLAAIMFNRTIHQTEQDLLAIMKTYPTEDVRTATTLRHQGLLH